jgi:CRISPR-associated protein Csm2
MTTQNVNGQNVNGETSIANWVKNGINPVAIGYAEEFGKWLATNKLTTTQIRNVYGEVKRIQMRGYTSSFESELLLLKPKLAYAKARKTGGGAAAATSAESLQKVLSKGIDAIFSLPHDISEENQKETKLSQFETFASFFEAVLAYHRAFGGK